MKRKMSRKEILQKLEYLHFALQEAQNQPGLEDDPEIENAIYTVEDLREVFWCDRTAQ